MTDTPNRPDPNRPDENRPDEDPDVPMAVPDDSDAEENEVPDVPMAVPDRDPDDRDAEVDPNADPTGAETD